MKIAYDIGHLWGNRWSPKPMKFWFRGIEDSDYELEPGLLRCNGTPQDLMKLEWSIAADFKVRGLPYYDTNRAKPWAAMFMMQHYGFPTRLLDWSESLAVAAHFACRKAMNDKDCAVWMMAPNHLLSISHPDSNGTHLSAWHPWADGYQLAGPWENADAFNEKPPIPVYPDHMDARISAQSARFTVHTFTPGALKRLALEDGRKMNEASFLHKIILPSRYKTTIRQHCQTFTGISEETLFPGLEGIARELMYELSEKGIFPKK